MTEDPGYAGPNFLSAQTQDAQRSDAEFLRSILASSADCIKVLDLHGNLIFMTDSGQEIMEVGDFNAIKGCPWPEFWKGEGQAMAKAAVETAKAGGTGRFQGPAETFAGTRKYWDVQVTPIYGASGAPEKLLSVSRDITADWTVQQQRDELAREITHRMKNLLTMVQVIATQTFSKASSIEGAREVLTGRLHALAQAQEPLSQANWRHAPIAAVVKGAVAPHSTDEERISFSGPEMELTPQQSLGLSLALHELSTNAAKYGALSNAAGKIHINWATGPRRSVDFEWRETGGPIVKTPGPSGFGRRLIETIIPVYFEGEAQLSFEPTGLVFRLHGSLG